VEGVRVAPASLAEPLHFTVDHAGVVVEAPADAPAATEE
jgi:hypothetical protein